MLTEILIFGIVLAITWKWFAKRSENFPPGPMGFPLVGHLPLLGTTPHKTLSKWTKTYGPLIGVNFGSFRTLVINDPKMIREALNLNAFAGRPFLKPVAGRSGGVVKGLLFTEGHTWLDQRRFTLKNLRDFGLGKNSMESKIQDEVLELMETFKASAGKPLQMRNVFNAAVLNGLWSIMLGERMKQDDPELLDAVRRMTSSFDDNNFNSSVATFIPWLAEIAPKLSGYEEMLKEVDAILGFINGKIDKHRETYVSGEPRDYIDMYMDETKKTTDPASPFHEKNGQMTFALVDLFIAGAETTSTTITWLYAYLVTWPEVQEKLAKEIDEVVGTERLPTLADRQKMRYTEAVLNEVMRYSSLAPFGVFHSATEDVEFQGYHIPKGTMVIPNLYSVHYDESVWGDPHNFRPERFLDDNGNLKKFENLLPFSTGKRVCLGESLARDELFLFTTHLFQKFEACPAGTLPNLEPGLGAVMVPKPFEIILKERHQK